ncbi:hypothetical protein OG901_58250 [Streptomyces mirabilis]|uniref:hypothetical protein n=1 Tax=Streptomyces mirabilis TaxID=68239 RepID=UPI00224E3EFD|nr:hypothetical protein [Streptomyces mirabilis]MCX5357117.1 hypothetical protein [Streptomyces mirabilis]
MTRISRTQRLVLLTATTALVSGGGLLSSSAFAAPATPHSAPAITVTSHSDRGDGDWHNQSDRGDGDWQNHKDKDKKRGGKTVKVTKKETTKEVEVRPDGTRIFRQTTKVETTKETKKGFHKSDNELHGPVNGRQ